MTVITGTPGNDRLVGGTEDDQLIGSPGQDILIGGDGDDQLTGGPGDGDPDQFAFDSDDGDDVIVDFELSSSGDSIVLLGGTPQDIEVVVASVTENPLTGDATLIYGDTTIALQGIIPEVVTDDWFILG